MPQDTFSALPTDAGAQSRLAAQARGRRSAVRGLLEARGAIGGFRAPHRDLVLHAADGTRLAASYLPGPGADAPAALIAHGFAAHRRKPAYALLADVLAGFAHVLILDLRGHGESDGRCTVGDRERFDVAAGIEVLRAAGHERVVGVGLSMGGIALLHAANQGARVDAAVVISVPARARAVETPDMARLDRVWRTGWKRWSFQVTTGVRVAPISACQPCPDPLEVVPQLDAPLLVVHADGDHFFPFERHAPPVAEATTSPVTLWREPADFGHAEDGITPAFAVALGQALQAVVITGQFPDRSSSTGGAYASPLGG
jgi:pimeloyl-ACP methyl ester carboxylesterase